MIHLPARLPGEDKEHKDAEKEVNIAAEKQCPVNEEQDEVATSLSEQPAARPGLLKQLDFVVTKNQLEHLRVTLEAKFLAPFPAADPVDMPLLDRPFVPVVPVAAPVAAAAAAPDGALNGSAWAFVLRACGVEDFHPLVMYEPKYYQVETKNPITAFFWCPKPESIVGEDIIAASPNTDTVKNFRTILEDYPDLQKRLISVRNLHPSLCCKLWSQTSKDDKRPEVYMKQIDQACADMARYMEDNKEVELKNTSYLIMCGDKTMPDPQTGKPIETCDFVARYLTQFKFPSDPNSSKGRTGLPKIVIGGHPQYYESNNDPSKSRENDDIPASNWDLMAQTCSGDVLAKEKIKYKQRTSLKSALEGLRVPFVPRAKPSST